jgi:CRISPR-associated protein Csm1
LYDPVLRDLYAYAGGFRYLANHVPTDEGAPLLFEDIAEASEGRSLLGYVKADVDHLGIIFAQGLGDDREGHDTICHTTMLSRELDLFFSGRLEHVLDKPDGEHSTFYTVFSGGDDLLVLGPWDQAARLARTINDEFEEFVGHNQDITLSAGILFTKERYPVARAAGDVDDVLRYSKERGGPDGESRNQLTVLNDTFKWDEAPRIFEEIDTLTGHAEGLTSGFLRNLFHYGQLYRQYKAGEVEGLRYKALFAYNIARVLRQGDPAVRQWADSLMQSLNAKRDARTMEHLDLVATYVLLARRGG